jgi:hypothetical protein
MAVSSWISGQTIYGAGYTVGEKCSNIWVMGAGSYKKENYKMRKNKRLYYTMYHVLLKRSQRVKKSQSISLLPSLIFLHFSHIHKKVLQRLQLPQSIRMHMIIHKYKLILQTYIICNYNLANMLLTGALIYSNKHGISHHTGE